MLTNLKSLLVQKTKIVYHMNLTLKQAKMLCVSINMPDNQFYTIHFDNYYYFISMVVYLAKRGIYSSGWNRIPNCKFSSEKEFNKYKREVL